MSRLIVFAAVSCLLPMMISLPAARGESYESFAEPFRKIELAPAESGVVDEIYVIEGAEVKAGQVLASLDKDVLTAARDIAQAAATAEGRFKAVQADLRLREARLRKISELRLQGHASPDEVLRAETELEAAQAQQRAVEEQRRVDLLELKKAEAMIERRLLRSPIDGVVTKLHREQGEFVTPVAPTVVTVVQIHPLRAVFNLPRSAGSNLKAGAVVRLQIPDVEDAGLTGNIEYVAPVVDAESETIRVKVLINNSAGRLAAGARCSLTLDESEADASVVNR